MPASSSCDARVSFLFFSFGLHLFHPDVSQKVFLPPNPAICPFVEGPWRLRAPRTCRLAFQTKLWCGGGSSSSFVPLSMNSEGVWEVRTPHPAAIPGSLPCLPSARLPRATWQRIGNGQMMGSFRLEGTSGDLQSNLLLKPGQARLLRALSHLALKTSKDGGPRASKTEHHLQSPTL